jgi:hypothetical protein
MGGTLVQDFAGDGLRTLCCAVRDIDDEFFESWKLKYAAAAAARTEREQRLDSVYDEIETHLKLIGKKIQFVRSYLLHTYLSIGNR